MKKRLISGVKPTGDIHIGNYFGAMKQFVDLQNDYESYVFIADLHALNQIHDPKKLKNNILEIAKAYISIGLDPKKVTLFRQSDVPAVSELCWIFNSITPLGLLQRAHAYKDAVAKGKNINAGLFDYPVLMAADILMYGADVVPVGEDQKQHVEITQDIAQKFNNLYGNTFVVPQELILKEVSTISGLDGRKMSKSYDNVIGLFEDDESLKQKVMSIVTDSRKPEEPKNPKEDNIFALHKLFLNEKELLNLANRYKEGKISYKESKEMLFEEIKTFVAPIRAKKKELDGHPEYVVEVLENGKDNALKEANKTIEKVKAKVGLKIR